MGAFRERFQQDLKIRGYRESTIRLYLIHMRDLVRYCKRPPDQLTLEEIRRYQLHLTQERRVAWSTFNAHVAAIRVFYRFTLPREWDIEHVPYQKKRRTLPVVLSVEEVAQLFAQVANLKHRTILMTMYSAGLRVSEVCRLRLRDLDSDRMEIRIEDGKGGVDRVVKLDEELLPLLRQYWREYHPVEWLFPGQDPTQPLHPRTVRTVVHAAAQAAGIAKPVSPHSLRHSWATHALEAGENLRKIQVLLGHRSLRSTECYTHLASDYLSTVRSSLRRLPKPPAAPAVPSQEQTTAQTPPPG